MAVGIPAQQTPLNASRIIKDISAQAEAAKQYAFEGDLQLAGQRGTNPGKILSQANVRLAIGPEGKYLLRIEQPDKSDYLLVSNGQKSWAYVPKLKQYTEEETAGVAGEDDSDDDAGGGSSDERDLAETFARQVIPILARAYKTASAADINGEAEVKAGKKKVKWPVVRVLSKSDKTEGQSMTELAVDPGSLTIGRLVWTNVTYSNGEKTVIRMTVEFSSLLLTDRPPDSIFDFSPPKGAKLVDAVPIPGQTGSFLLNHAAPDFELKTLDGDRIRLAALHGHPVLLTFMASWCGPCRREMPGMVKLYDELKGRGLIVLGVNDEGKSKAQKFAADAGLTFQILDDSGLKAHRLFRVHSIPAVFLIDGDGKVVRFLRGTHDYAALRSAVKAVGL